MSLLPSLLRSHSTPAGLPLLLLRSLATESFASPQSDLSHLPPPSKHPASKPTKPRLYPHPRPSASHAHSPALPKLPPSFGRNQLLPVADETRALLESIVSKFNAPIRYAFAYGSGVFEQDGYASTTATTAGAGTVQGKKPEPPMLDFLFAVTHSAHFHSINMAQFPSHYPLHARMLGSSYVSRVEELGPGVWFNAYVPMDGVVRCHSLSSFDPACFSLEPLL